METNELLMFLLRLTLGDGNLDLDASFENKYAMSISASMGEINFDQIKDWIINNSIKIQ